MCCVSFASAGSASNRISGRARRSFSQGLGACIVAHPASASVRARDVAAASRLMTHMGLSATREKRANLILERVPTIIAEPLLDIDNGPSHVDQIGTRHAFDRVRLRRRSDIVIDHGEARGVGLEELLCVSTAAIDVDGDDGQAAVSVTLLHFIHPRERSPAWTAPRRPEVDIDDLAAQIGQRDRLAVGGRERKRRRGLADRRGARPSRDVRQGQQSRHGGGSPLCASERTCWHRHVRQNFYWHTVPGARNTWRVMCFVCAMPLTLYEKVAVVPSEKARLALPTTLAMTFDGLNGTALKAGPVVRINEPE